MQNAKLNLHGRKKIQIIAMGRRCEKKRQKEKKIF